VSLLEIDGVSVQFGGLAALDDVTLHAQAGAVTGLIGPNGAGKTTLFNVITGLERPRAGVIRFDGANITALRTHRRAALGIARTFQRLEVFGSLSVRDNVRVAAEMDAGANGRLLQTDEVLDRCGLISVADERVDTLPTGQARLVELARALAARPRLLLLDEPSSGLNEDETAALGRLLTELTADGLAVLLVEHDMPFVMSTCSDIHVLDFGRVIATGPPSDVRSDEAVIVAYLGDTHAGQENRSRTTEPAGADPVAAVELRDVHAGYGDIEVLHGVNLSVRVGEVFALLGANGAGKSTLLKVLSAQLAPSAGEIELLGTVVNGATPDALARAGVCLIPEGRGVFRNLTVIENLRMVTYAGTDLATVIDRAFTHFPRLAERRDQTAGTLSGGEQQMLALARALAGNPRILLLDELSMGLAPLVVEQLYEVAGGIAAEGVTTVVVEQFAHGILDIAHRAAVMQNGRIEEIGTPSDIAGALAGVYLGDHRT
jgi:ABC-type branched-subunit amino acid transport system ATPase component